MARKPKPGPFKTTESLRPTLEMRRTDGFQCVDGDTETLPLVQRLYLNANRDVIAVAPCGQECAVVTDMDELDAMVAFLKKVAVIWEQTDPD